MSTEGLPRFLTRDLFSTKEWGRFALDVPLVPIGPRPREDRQGPNLLERLRVRSIERQKAQQQRVDQVEAELATLELNSTMVASEPAAFVSGRIVHEGEVIKGFRILRIKHREVEVRKNGITRILSIP